MSGDAGQASLDNNLSMTAKLAFIQKLDLPRNILSTTGKGMGGTDRPPRRRRKGLGDAAARAGQTNRPLCDLSFSLSPTVT